MRILALITARGGSKRLPGKNIRILGGRPLISWSINVVKDYPEICDILVSTDERKIASVSEDAGAYVPWLRPAELATDTASSVDVALHALEWYELNKAPVDGLLLLQPTSPFRKRGTVSKGIQLFHTHGYKPVLAVSPARDHPMLTLKKEGEGVIPFIDGNRLNVRTQDLPEALVVNGCFYLISPTDLYTQRTFVGEGSIPLVIDSPVEALDIDNEWDWDMAECYVNYLEANEL